MIKKQYQRYPVNRGYFHKFLDEHGINDVIKEQLKSYDATLGKSKHKFSALNVKWHNREKYVMFVLRWS